MTRVPTTASYNLYMSRLNSVQSRLNDANYQAVTGERYSSYDKYGLTSYRLLTLENEQTNVSKYMETNKITQVNLEAKEKAIDSIRTVMLEFRNELRDFSAADLKAMTPDYSADPPELPTEEELENIQRIQTAAFEAMSQMAYFLNTKVDGVYIFGGGDNNQPPVDFPYTTLEEFQAVFDGNFLTFPTSGSSNLSSVTTSDSVTGGLSFSQNQYTMHGDPAETGTLTFQAAVDPETGETTHMLTGNPGSFLDLKPGGEIQITGAADPANNGIKIIKSISADGSTIIFDEATPVVDEVIDGTGVPLEDFEIAQSEMTGVISALKNTGDILETYTIQAGANNLTVDAANNTISAADAGTFSKIKPGQTITLDDGAGNVQTLYVKGISADGRTLSISSDTPVTGGNITAGTVTLNTHSDICGFISDTMKGSELQTGDISFNPVKNQMTATVTGAFSHLKPGGTIVVQGADGNNGVKYIKSVSEDGRTVTFSDETPVTTAQTITNGTGVTIGRTYPVGSTLNLGNVNNRYDGNYTITGVSDDGKSLIVKTDKFPEYGATATFNATGIQSVSTESYYQGGSLTTTHRLNETTSLSVNITAESSGFEKIFRAMGNIAQGNLLDMRNPLETLDEVDENRAYNRVQDSLALLDDALESRPNSKEPNGDITSIHYSIVSKLDLVKTTIEDQTAMENSLTSYIDSIKKVDKKEAVTMLLQEIQNLNVSYSVLAQMNQLSLLNYL